MQSDIKPYPTIQQGFGLVILFMVCSLIYLVTDEIFGIDHNNAPFLTAVISDMLSYSLSFTIVIVYALRRMGDPKGNELRFAVVPSKILWLLVLITPFAGLLIEPIASVIPLSEELEQWIEDEFANMSQPHILSFISIAVFPALFEEILFRGIVLEGMLSRYKPAVAIFWSAFLFGIMHLNPPQFVAGFFLGIFIGWLYWRTRSLLPGMVVHLVNNGFCWALLVSASGEDSLSALIGMPQYVSLLILSVVVVTSGIYFICRLLPQNALADERAE